MLPDTVESARHQTSRSERHALNNTDTHAFLLWYAISLIQTSRRAESMQAVLEFGVTQAQGCRKVLLLNCGGNVLSLRRGAARRVNYLLALKR